MSARAPRVALVHDWLTGMRGGEKVLEAIAESYPDAPIYTLFHFSGAVSPALEAHPIETSFLQRLPGVRRHYRRLLPLFPTAIEDFDLSRFDWVISSSHSVAKGVVVAPGACHVCYCHTPMRYAWDQEHAYFPRRRGITARLRGIALSRLRTWDATSSSRVDHFVANSHFVAARIRRFYRREATVIHPPVDTDFFFPSNEVGRDEEPFCLSVAALAPYKRHELAIAACRRLEMPLVIVGDGPHRRQLARRAGAEVRFAGRLEGEQLRALYRRAAAFVQPQIEDFGIAAVEALACGAPVVAAARGGVVDIVEDGEHGVLYSPETGAEGLAAAIDKARQQRFNTLNLRRQAERFSRSHFTRKLRAQLSEWGLGQRLAGGSESSSGPG